MTEEHSRAVSFANSYFTLVDGLASGLDDYLAEDVILDWFGRTVKGRANVNIFMKAHKVNSRHIFNNIMPTESIGYRKYNMNRKRVSQVTDTKQINCPSNFSENVENSWQATDNEGNYLKQEGVSYELSDNHHNALSKLEITPTMVKEMEYNIERVKNLQIKLKRKKKRKKKKEFFQDDGVAELETHTKRIKFVEATGEIHLWKKRKDEEDVYGTIPASSYIWKRPCKLQVAYSLIKSESFHNSRNLNTGPKSKSPISDFQSRRLPNFEEISKWSSRLVPNINGLGDYRSHTNFSEDRDNFLKSFSVELATDESRFPRFVPQYVGNRLVFRRTNFDGCEQSNDFVFNYEIHMIIYEGDNMCRLNLSEKFDEME